MNCVCDYYDPKTGYCTLAIYRVGDRTYWDECKFIGIKTCKTLKKIQRKKENGTNNHELRYDEVRA